jgi:dipeptidyl aminopeptidase/acylaminoacyl peptidase
MMKQVTKIAFCLSALLALACSPGGVTTGGGVPGVGLGPDAGLPSNGRVSNGLVALYLFDEGTGNTIYDHSGVSPALDLTIETTTAVSWVADGLSINNPALITSGSADRISQTCQTSNAVTVEVWAKTADLGQTGPARLIDFGIGPNDFNFSIAQDGNEGSASLRTTSTVDLEGEVAQAATLLDIFAVRGTHLVYTRSGITDEYELWVDGQRNATGQLAGSFSNWQTGSILSIGNEPLGNRPWEGEVYMAAVYCRALGAEEVLRNFQDGY